MNKPDEKPDAVLADVSEAPEPEAEAKPEAETKEPATPKVSSIEDVASRMGWSPKEKWHGPAEKWKPADEFLISTVDINHKLARDLKATKESVDRISRTSAAIAEREIERRMAELSARHDAAVEAGDKEGAKRLGVEIAKAQAAPATTQDASLIKDFEARNPWFGEDPDASDLAYKTAEMWMRKGADHATQMQKAEEVVRKRFPTLFEGGKPAAQEAQPEARKPAPAVNSPATRTGATNPHKKGQADLPEPARRAAVHAMKDFVRRGRCTEEEYWKMYFEESA